MSYPATPECDRLVEVAPVSQKIGEFLDWLMYDKEVTLMIEWCDYNLEIGELCQDCVEELGDLEPIDDDYTFCTDNHRRVVRTEDIPLYVDHNKLLAEFFGIDLNEVEAERRAILKHLQENQ